SIILMSEKDMNNLFNIGDESDIIVVKIESEEITGKVAKDLEDKLRRDRKQKKGEEDFSIQTPEKAFESVSLILNIINLIVSGIAGISLLVGGIGVANVMYASVLERTRDIGVMKAVGARNSDILYIFVIESCLLGLIGGIAGSFLGIGLAFLASASANAYFDNQILKVTFSLQLIIASVIFSLFIGLLAGVLPARQAAKLKPVEALRR
ncbi:MAG: FtsX-like permease family protein, partial [Nanoarchaeota archaeon]